MNYLLDTCTLLWYAEGSSKISPGLQERLTDPRNRLFLSDASVLEIVIKYRLKKLKLSKPPSRILPHIAEKYSMETLPMTRTALFQLEKLPLLHRDPFDRILIAQAREFDLTVVTPDPLFAPYQVPVIW